MRGVRRFGPAGPLALVAVFLPIVGGFALLGVLQDLAPWCRANAAGAAPFVIAAAGAFLAGSSILPTYAITILAGWSFGFAVGMPTAFAAHTAAALLGFGLARAMVGNHVMAGLQSNPKWDGVRRAMVGRGYGRAILVVMLIRLAPVAPFGITNLLAASTGCPVGAFLIGSTIGILPQTTLLVFASARMGQLSFEQEPWMVAFGVICTFVAIAALGAVARRALARVTAEGALAEP